MIRPLEVGEIVDSLPLHMTFVHWFSSSSTPVQIKEIMKGALTDEPPFQLMVGKEDMFGPGKDILVNRVGRTDQLLRFHKNMLRALKKARAQHTNLDWTGNGWNPHVTQKSNDKLSPGETFLFDSISLVSSNDFEHGPRKLEATINL